MSNFEEIDNRLLSLLVSEVGIDADYTHEHIPTKSFTQNVHEFQEKLKTLEQVDTPLTHHFAPGNYGREIYMPAHSIVIGKTHRHSHINVVSKGKAYVATEQGVKLIEAPCTFVSEVGTKRALYVLEDMVWTTVHCNPTDTQDLEAIEVDVIVPDHQVLEFRQSIGLDAELSENILCHGQQ